MRKEKRANGPHTSHRIRAGLLAVCLTLGAAIPGGTWAAGKDPRQAVSGDEATLTMAKSSRPTTPANSRVRCEM